MSFTVVEGDVTLRGSTGVELPSTDGTTIPAGTPGLFILGKDGTVGRFIALDSSGKVSIQNPPNLDVALSTRATESTLISIKDIDGIKKITDPLPAGTNNIGDVDVVSSVLPTGAATETTLLAANQNLIDIETLLTSIKNTDGIKKITDALPVGDNIIGRTKLSDGTDLALIESNGAIRIGIYGNGGTVPVDVSLDGTDGKYRLEIVGKVSVSAPPAPPASTPVSIDASSPLSVTTTSTTTYVIPNGETLTITSITAGAEGDPNERGSKVEVFYYDGTERIIERIYLTGQTVPLFPDTAEARDGTALVGNGVHEIRVRRTRLGGSSVEIDAVIRGYLT